MSAQWTWEETLAALRALGGVAQNVAPGRGPSGRALVPLDPGQPVLLRVPRNLLIPCEAVELLDDRVRLKDSANVSPPEREFFEQYYNGFSWTEEVRSQCAAHISSLDGLPSEVREMLVSVFGFGPLWEGDAGERRNRHFFESREYLVNGSLFLAPLIELANHDPAGLPLQKEEYLQIGGAVRGEVFACYGIHDAFSIFRTFGFASREPASFSLATILKLEGMEITIHRDTSQMTKRGKDWIPKLESEGSRVLLPFLMIGHPNLPKLSRGTFCTLLREAGMKNPDEAFDQILRYNWRMFLKLLRAMESYDGEMIAMLRKMVRFQLEAMTYCVGSRQLEQLAEPTKDVWSLSIQ